VRAADRRDQLPEAVSSGRPVRAVVRVSEHLPVLLGHRPVPTPHPDSIPLRSGGFSSNVPTPFGVRSGR
jgi:hypothetical protein